MSDGQAWMFGIIAVLIFLALATIASNMTALIKALKPDTEPRPEDPVFVEFGGQSDYSPRLFINAASVTYIGLLTGEGGAEIHLVNGEKVGVHEEMKEVATRLETRSAKRLR